MSFRSTSIHYTTVDFSIYTNIIVDRYSQNSVIGRYAADANQQIKLTDGQATIIDGQVDDVSLYGHALTKSGQRDLRYTTKIMVIGHHDLEERLGVEVLEALKEEMA